MRMAKQSLSIFPRLLIRLNAIKPMYRLFCLAEGSLIYKFKSILKYYPIYIHHTLIQKQLYINNLKYHLNQQSQSNYKTKIHSLYSSYTANLLAQINSKKQSFLEQQHTSSRYEKQARNILHQCMQYLSLYYESLQNLIQGRREVIHQQNFLFQDGQSVKQKKLKFEKYLNKLLGRNQEELRKANTISQQLQTEQEQKNAK